ncbi:PQQ-dependent sugar dehydrogenase [Roseicyclus persicicus]|uniref:PQQ-dependent sugar dehydrogenase n=1 Tax=Roseicyclus persicicus TaxID=2650661 RepID=A0A7X6H1H9_9RHOB|nr:PQQ-dependent sugar dehydrogenase [Roseibacterium persicicum]NKX46322.1 PQQ-dependent sugar dehydrogenase [Roseibacterium persicicum]
MKPAKTGLMLCAALASTALVAIHGTAAQANAPSLTYETVMSELNGPWDMAFLEDGTMFFTEKCHGLSVRMPSGDVMRLLGMTGSEGYATTADDLFCEGQAGMLGVAVDPDFASNRLIYVYSASTATGAQSNHVLRLRVADDFASVSDRVDIVDDIPYKPAASDHPFGGPGAHNGGRIRFHDGYLYVTTGDIHSGDGPQSPVRLAGKVLRIDGDGNPAPDNGAPEGFDPRIFTYGHRNVQGIAFDPDTGAVVIAEHGPWHSDEVTVLRPGGNGGWDPRPNMAGRGDCPDNYCGYSPNQMEGMDPAERAAFMPMTDTATYPDAMPPAWVNDGLSQGTGSAAFLVGDQWGDWNGMMAVGIMGIGFGGTPVGQRIDLLNIADDGMSAEVISMPLPMEPGRFRSVVLGPDGNLYAAMDEGEIYRIIPN